MSASSPPVPRWAWAALFVFAVAVKVGFNLHYLQRYGYPSSPGGDIWFFAGVAQGTHPLFAADPLQWLLRPFGACEPLTLYLLLLVLSNLLSLLSLGLLVLALRRFFRDDRAALWGGALYACLSKSVIFCTGSFHHQQESLAFIMAALWAASHIAGETEAGRLHRWRILFAIFALLGLCVGPDMVVALAALLPCAVIALARRAAPSLSIPWRAGLLLLGYLAILLALRPVMYQSAVHLARSTRGIDLPSQLAMGIADLLPLSLTAMSHTREGMLGLTVLAIGMLLSAWSLSRGRLLPCSLFLCGVVFATLAVRFFFVAEIGLAFLFAWWRSVAVPRRSLWPLAAAVVVAATTSGLHLWNRLPCAYPAALGTVLDDLRRDPQPAKKVFCTPTYGFIVEACGRAAATSDMHHLEPGWVEAASRSAWDAVAYFKVRGVTHMLLTSDDFRLAVRPDATGRLLAGTICSGGFERFIPQLSDDDLAKTLVYRARTGDHSVPGTKVLAARTDLATGLEVVLLRIE